MLFANAGGRRVRARWSRSPRSTSTSIFDINVKGTLFTVQKALPLLNDGASVILNASTAADNGDEAFGVYAASKAAVRSFARTWANELKGRGIRVNAVSPGPDRHPGITGLVGDRSTRPRFKAQPGAGVPAGPDGPPGGGRRRRGLPRLRRRAASSPASNLYVDGGQNQI